MSLFPRTKTPLSGLLYVQPSESFHRPIDQRYDIFLLSDIREGDGRGPANSRKRARNQYDAV